MSLGKPGSDKPRAVFKYPSAWLPVALSLMVMRVYGCFKFRCTDPQLANPTRERLRTSSSFG